MPDPSLFGGAGDEPFAFHHYQVGSQMAVAAFGSNTEPETPLPGRTPAQLLEDAKQLPTSFEQRQYAAYSFDLLVQRLGQGPKVRERRNALARELGHESFYDASCWVRGLDPDAVLSVAAHLVDRVHAISGDAVMRHFEGEIPTLEEFSDRYRAHLTANHGNHSSDQVLARCEAIVRDLGLTEVIALHDGSANNVSTNVTQLWPRRADLFLARSPGLESWRAATHALGHAYFAVRPETDWIDLLGVNISATEVVAFRAQTIALLDAGSPAAEFLALMPPHYAKIYAQRVQNEARFYRHGSDAVVQVASRPSHAIGYSDAFRPDKRLASVDFVLAFEKYFDGPEIERFSDLKSHVLSNLNLAAELSCLASDVDPGAGR